MSDRLRLRNKPCVSTDRLGLSLDVVLVTVDTAFISAIECGQLINSNDCYVVDSLTVVILLQELLINWNILRTFNLDHFSRIDRRNFYFGFFFLSLLFLALLFLVELFELAGSVVDPLVQVGQLVAIAAELNNIASAATVPHNVHYDVEPDYDHYIEYDEQGHDSYHDIADDVVSEIIHPWEGSLENEKHPAEDIQDQLVDYVLHLDNPVAPLAESEKQPQHQDASADHYLETPVGDISSENKQCGQSNTSCQK